MTAAGAIVLVLAVVAWTLWDPSISFLVSTPAAPWVRVDRPFTAQPFGDASISTDFRTNFVLDQPVPELRLKVAVVGEARAFLNRTRVDEWEQPYKPRQVRELLLRDIPAGRHELLIVGITQWGPNALSVQCDDLPVISTTAAWDGSELERDFKPLIRADQRPLTPTALQFPSSPAALASLWPMLIVVVVLAGAAVLPPLRVRDPLLRSRLVLGAPGWIRIGSLVAFGLLALNNLARGWTGEGFDYYGHTDYVAFILNRGSLPLPRDGLQMFQSPLYYMLSAVVVKSLMLFTSPESAFRWLVLINLACGLAQIEICWRALKHVFPDRPLAQSLGMLFGGLLPMNVYFSHYVGNQALEGLFTALALMLTMKHLAATEWANGKQLTLVGVVVGLALLAKVNAIVPAALIVTVLMIRSVIDQRSAWLTCEDLFFLTAPILAVAGWYYFRNWLNFGRPFLGGWGADAAFKWWQDRGFNTPSDLYTFGTGITHPVYAAFGSLWDGFYSSMWLDAHLGGSDFETRPRWNDNFLVSSALIGIVPTAGLLAGLALPFARRREAHPALLFASVATVALLGAYIAFNLRNPCFASGKAFYVIGGLPCLAVMAGAGLEALAKPRWLRPLVIVAVTCVPLWSLGSYLIVR
jgi:hypothetical protein